MTLAGRLQGSGQLHRPLQVEQHQTKGSCIPRSCLDANDCAGASAVDGQRQRRAPVAEDGPGAHWGEVHHTGQVGGKTL